MRIIAGSLKGRRLRAPDTLDVRPTADRAREALFSILQRWPSGAFADLYAGSGAVALEAWSRGYAPVACVERAPAALACLRDNIRGTDIRVLACDARRLGSGAFRDLACLFADPPYAEAQAAWADLARLAPAWLAPGGILVFEAPAGTELPPAPGTEPLEVRRYGAAQFHLLRAVC